MYISVTNSSGSTGLPAVFCRQMDVIKVEKWPISDFYHLNNICPKEKTCKTKLQSSGILRIPNRIEVLGPKAVDCAAPRLEKKKKKKGSNRR